MLQLHLFKSRKLIFRQTLRVPPEEAIDEALIEMIKFGASGAKLTPVDCVDQTIWEEGDVPRIKD